MGQRESFFFKPGAPGFKDGLLPSVVCGNDGFPDRVPVAVRQKCSVSVTGKADTGDPVRTDPGILKRRTDGLTYCGPYCAGIPFHMIRRRGLDGDGDTRSTDQIPAGIENA